MREELELAGHPDGFEFDMNIPATSITGAEFVQANLAPYGIILNIVVKPAPDYYLEFFEKRVNTFMSGMSVRADPWQQLAFLGRADGPYDFVLPPGDKDAEVQAAFQKVTEIFDPEPRAEAFRELKSGDGLASLAHSHALLVVLSSPTIRRWSSSTSATASRTSGRRTWAGPARKALNTSDLLSPGTVGLPLA